MLALHGGAATVLLDLLVGVVVALPLAAGTITLSAALRGMPTEPALGAERVLGSQGVVVCAVPAGGPGSLSRRVTSRRAGSCPAV